LLLLLLRLAANPSPSLLNTTPSKLEGSVANVRGAFDRAAAIDDITSIQGKDLEITKRGDKVVVGFKYSREIALAGPAFLVYRFEEQTK
jgi:hypothetical protein